MARGLGFHSLVAASILAGLSAPVAGEEAGRPTIVVEVFDHVGVPAETLSLAKKDVTQIYGDVGVDIRWTDTTATDAQGRFVVHLIIRPKAPRPRMMGRALGDSRDTSGTAFVYHERVMDVARARGVAHARVLAYAMAHEMGHLLLPYPSHAVTGIMHADWSGDELRDIAEGVLRFAPAQATAIRARAADAGAIAIGAEDHKR
jgi:hypothetical protein